jgi:hypothetical protein
MKHNRYRRLNPPAWPEDRQPRLHPLRAFKRHYRGKLILKGKCVKRELYVGYYTCKSSVMRDGVLPIFIPGIQSGIRGSVEPGMLKLI